MKKTSIAVLVLSFGGIVGAFAAPVVTYVGTTGLAEAQAWRDSSVAKSYSVNASNIYGTSGYVAFGVKTDTTGGSNIVQVLTNSYFPDLNPAGNVQWVLPTWVNSSNTPAGSVVLGADGPATKNIFNFGGPFDSSNFSNNPSPYPVINDPLNSAANYRVGVSTTDPVSMLNVNFFTLRFTETAVFRLGILVNTLIPEDAMDSIGIWNGESATVQGLTRSDASLVFFDLSVQSGDWINIYGSVGETAGRGNLSYITLDAIPEPGVTTMAMTAAALLGLMRLRARRSTAA